VKEREEENFQFNPWHIATTRVNRKISENASL